MGKKLIGLIAVLIFLVVALTYEARGPNADGSKLREIENFWREMPLLPGSTEVDTSSSSSGRKAIISKGYNSSANYDELKRFCLEPLTRKGWQLENERGVKDWGRDKGGMMLEFRQGEYKLTIQYAGEKSDYGWDYGISISWGVR